MSDVVYLGRVRWRVLVVWECSIKGFDDAGLNKLGLRIVHWLRSDEEYRKIANNSAF